MVFINIKKAIVAVFVFITLFYFSFQYWPVSIQIKDPVSEDVLTIRMPLKDKRRLEYFFRHVSFLEAWAYTLVGRKPMSTYQYTEPLAQVRKACSSQYLKCFLRDAFWPPNFYKICALLNPEELKIHRGCETLKKYLRYFPESRLSFLTYRARDSICIVLVDKIQLHAIVQDHLDDFQSTLDALSMTPQELFSDPLLRRFLENVQSEGLFGILLGYGKWNSFHFEQHGGSQGDLMTSMWPDELEEWMERMNNKDHSFQPWDISDLFYPRFCCLPDSDETRSLIRVYKEDREKIVLYFGNRDIVEAILSLFNQKAHVESVRDVTLKKLGRYTETT
ncbi:MAG: hypothetical protein KGR16_06580 [Verrucomicrobia bacterium]|nr:hypothetical protein [Verrucomicrobiota bacterium]